MANSLYEALIGLNQGQHRKNLLNSLYGVQTEPEETLPGQVAQTIGAYSPYVVNPYMSTKQALGIGLGTALLGGISSFLGARQAANENVKNRALLVKALGATSPDELRDVIAQDTSGKVTPVAYELYSKNLEKKAEEEKAKEEIKLKLGLALAEKGISTPTMEPYLQGADLSALKPKIHVVEDPMEKLRREAEFLNSPEGESYLEAQRKLSSARTFGTSSRQEEEAQGKKERIILSNDLKTAQRKNILTPKETEDINEQTNFASKASELKNELQKLSYPEIQLMIRTGKSPSSAPGLYSKFLQVQQIYRKPNFGLTLTGNELKVGEGIFGKNILSNKEDMISAIDYLKSSALDKSKNYLVTKQKDVPQLEQSIDSMRQEKPVLSIKDQIAKLKEIAFAPNVSAETKSAALAKLDELEGK